MMLIDGDRWLDYRSLCQPTTTLVHARIPVTSVMSFMFPNWHEFSRNVFGIKASSNSCRLILLPRQDRKLRFILEDADGQMVFFPTWFDSHDYTAMLEWVTTQLSEQSCCCTGKL
ncbi:hypothetical protein [Mycobacterium leprae]|uniref:hypothetical protein n=1 Tax=Mycobacterium leprae TaxID=1769 RepID=UPI001E588705|nr:hypothetical protein [Mycobacterium leprae]